MQESDKLFAGSIPENYDRYMVPLVFQPYADDLARRAAALAPKTILELAAGTGVVTRALAPLLPAARYVATDLNPSMLDYATALQPAGQVEWQPADAMSLPFADGSFDLVLCQFGAMFFPDRPAAYREARRVLRPGGHFLFNVWDRIEANIFAAEIAAALAGHFPANPPGFMSRTPHGYGDTELIRADLAAAGFTRVAIETRAEQSRAPSPAFVATAFCQGTPLRQEIDARDPAGLPAATAAAESAIARLHGTGEVAASMQAHVILATT